MKLTVEHTAIPDVLVLRPRVFRDGRGWFAESFNEEEFAALVHRVHFAQLFIPRGFAHGFSVLSDEAVFQYKCDRPYAPEAEAAVAWDDPALGIDWGIPAGKVLLSPKDASHPLLSEVPAEDLFDYSEDLYK